MTPRKPERILDKTRKKWRSSIRGFKDQILRSQNGAVNLYAQLMAEDAEQAMGVAASGDVQFAQYTSNIICLDEDLDRLRENVRTVMKRIQNLGFSCRLETVNAVEAWRGSIPGDGYRNVRRVLLHTLNLADMLPITSVWAGERENPSRLNAEEQSTSTVRRHDRRDSVSGQPARFRSRTHADVRTFRRR